MATVMMPNAQRTPSCSTIRAPSSSPAACPQTKEDRATSSGKVIRCMPNHWEITGGGAAMIGRPKPTRMITWHTAVACFGPNLS
jgi:hypothetical protein